MPSVAVSSLPLSGEFASGSKNASAAVQRMSQVDRRAYNQWLKIPAGSPEGAKFTNAWKKKDAARTKKKRSIAAKTGAARRKAGG